MRITPGEYEATVEKIAKITARAEKRGFTGKLTVEAELVEEKKTNDLGFEVTEIFYDVTIGGEPPRYAGWEFRAKLVWDPEAGLIVSTAPGVESVNRRGLREGWCDHCKTKRHRTETYLVGNDKGKTVQVGSTCIKDFLGWSGSIVVFYADSVTDEIEGFLSGGGYAERRWPVETVLAAAWAAIQVDGYQPASSFGSTTKGTVGLILDPRTKWDRKRIEAYASHIERSYKQAKIIRDWLLGDGFAGDNEYVLNMKAIARAETCGPRNIGLLASAPQAWAKAQERDLVRRKEQAEIINEYVGSEKDRIEIEVHIKSIRSIEGDWGTSALYIMVGSDKHLYKWFSSSWGLGETADDTVYMLRGTVKKHDEYNGLKYTVLTRCKVI